MTAPGFITPDCMSALYRLSKSMANLFQPDISSVMSPLPSVDGFSEPICTGKKEIERTPSTTTTIISDADPRSHPDIIFPDLFSNQNAASNIHERYAGPDQCGSVSLKIEIHNKTMIKGSDSQSNNLYSGGI